MGTGRSGRHRAGEPARAFDPWAPRAPGAAAPPRSPGPGASPFRTPGEGTHHLVTEPFPPTTASGPPTAPDWERHRPGGRAPVSDDRRPPGASSQPPTTWPSPRVPDPLVPSGRERAGDRSTALWAFTAFLVGALLVGSAFAAYAWGRSDRTAAGRTTTTTAPTRATGPLDIQKLLDIARPSVVTIETGGPGSLFGGAGSGVVISTDGLILTNAHVIEGAGGNISVRFSDGTTASADLVGASTADDIALVQAHQTGLTPARLGSSDNLLVGDPVVAIGNALNLGGDPSVTSGIVSAKDRDISDGSVNLKHLIQTDAAINPGNSGGPLVNADGQVVGINTAIIQGAQNVGFSIPIDSVKSLITQLKAGGGDLNANTAVLGVSALDVTSPELDPSVRARFGITAEAGALVINVDANGGGAKAGLQVGDVIVELDGQPVTGSTELTRMVRTHRPGDQVQVVFERSGQRQSATVTLGP